MLSPQHFGASLEEFFALVLAVYSACADFFQYVSHGAKRIGNGLLVCILQKEKRMWQGCTAYLSLLHSLLTVKGFARADNSHREARPVDNKSYSLNERKKQRVKSRRPELKNTRRQGRHREAFSPLLRRHQSLQGCRQDRCNKEACLLSSWLVEVCLENFNCLSCSETIAINHTHSPIGAAADSPKARNFGHMDKTAGFRACVG